MLETEKTNKMPETPVPQSLENSRYIVDPNGGDTHGFVTGKEVAWAISRTIA